MAEKHIDEKPKRNVIPYVLKTAALSAIPATIFYAVALTLGRHIGLQTSADNAPEDFSITALMGVVVFAPVFESLIVRACYGLLSSAWRGRENHEYALAIAILAGLLHGLKSPILFFPATWSFFVFIISWRKWNQSGSEYHSLVLIAPHAIQNLFALLLVFMTKDL
jgi:hypothetical protein